jgi:ElaB/YqjD/DUF883 family membrane-anchored ribosome-binding protein
MKTIHLSRNLPLTLLFFLYFTFQGLSNDNAVPFKKLGSVRDGTQIQNIFTGIIKGRLNNKNYLLQNNMTGREYNKDLYSRAWSKVQQYYPGRFMFMQSDEYFMTHGPYSGRTCIEVYNSKILRGIIKNQKMFNPNNIVREYNNIKNNEPERKEFEEKMGRLSSYFKNDASHRQLYKYLGRDLYNRLMSVLREENTHLLTGALIHEGMHALLTDAQTANIQNDFKNGHLSMELNELRSYMAEIIYHCEYCNRAKEDIDGHWDEISNLIKQLEALRHPKPPDVTKEEKEKVEQIKAQIKAHIAMIRVRLREIKQSAKRMEDLMNHYRQNYIRNISQDKDKIDADLKLKDNFNAMAVAVSAFRQAADKYAAEVEKGLKELENILDKWNEWAECKIKEPPPEKNTTTLIDTTRTKPFPDTPINTAKEIKEKAEKEIGRNYAILEDETQTDTPEKDFARFSLTGGIGYAGTSPSELNEYYDYLNTTWNGNVAHINNGFSYALGINYFFLRNVGVGVEFENITISTEGILQTYDSHYSNENKANGIIISVNLRSNTPDKGFSLVGSFGAGQYFSNYYESEDDYVTEGTDNVVGLKASGGIQYSISPYIGIRAEVGYRSLNADSHNATFFMPSDPTATVDYSGITGMIKAVISF